MPTRGYGSHVPNPGPLAAGGHMLGDSVRVTIIPTLARSTSNPAAPGSTWADWINGSQRRMRIIRGREPTRLLGMAAASLGKSVEEILQDTPHGRSWVVVPKPVQD